MCYVTLSVSAVYSSGVVDEYGTLRKVLNEEKVWSSKHRWGSVESICNCTTDVRIDAFFSSNLCLTIFCHITVVICHFIVDNISGNLFKCKNKPSEMALISVSSHFKVIFESAFTVIYVTS